MRTNSTEAKLESSNPDCAAEAPQIEKETRFAVVMYGGISLAIYIHGVAQELYHLVRATARRVDDDECYLFGDDELGGTEKIYRCLGEALKRKFVVDILSGTSAGGINAVFLAKALANDRSMEMIKDFWIQQGDITMLVNDKDSLVGLSGLTLQDPPEGLLNSQRFYYKLLEALMKMGSSSPDIQSPYVEELDLNITTTDIRGLDLPIKISNNTVDELRFKNVFRFYYKQKPDKTPGNDRNDFSKNIDPFLAFAARCTASIPPAFEAMQLKDIEPILKTAMFKADYKGMDANEGSWKPFYEEYLNSGDNFSLRSFGDGGYLDNKPFSYATEALLRRRADFPVERRVLYIEPSPEHPENKPLSTERPDMVQNILAALVGLPRQETIRDDLKVIEERNKIIQMIKNVLSESSYHTPELINKPPAWVHTKEWANKYLMEHDVLRWYGSAYIAYHLLRVEGVIKGLSIAFSRAIGWNEEGTEEQKLNDMLHTWLDEKYSITKPSGRDKKYSQNDILFRLDLGFRMRKHNFLQHIMNVILLHIGDYMKNTGSAEIESIFEASDTAFVVEGKVDEECIEQCVKLLRGIKHELNNTYNYMRGRGRSLQKRGLIAEQEVEADLAGYVSELSKLKEYLDHPGEGVDGSDLIEALTLTLGTHVYRTARPGVPSGYLYITFNEISRMSKNLGIVRNKDGTLEHLMTEGVLRMDHSSYLDKNNVRVCLQVYQQVQKCLAFYYDNFEYYDMLTFPIQYGTEAGESDLVEIIRVSPEDATMIVDEKNTGKNKLAGTKLANFGAFFNKEWRENDMLWGRLDAAEILLNELLGKNDKTQYDKNLGLLRETISTKLNSVGDPYEMVFEEILKQDLRPRDKTILYEFLDEDLTPRGNSQDQKGGINFSQLNSLLKQDQKLSQVEADIRQTLGSSLDRLIYELSQSLHKNPELELKAFKDKLKIELDAVQKARAEIGRKIESEKKALENSMKEVATKGQQGHLRNLKDEKVFIESFPEKTRGMFSNLLAKFAKNDISRYQEILRSVAKDEKLLDYFKNGYGVNTELAVEPTVRLADRSAKVFSRLLSGLSKKYPIQKPVGILTFVLQVVSAFVNFALPKSFINFLIENYWIWLIYLAEAILLLAGYMTKSDAVKSIGQWSLIVTASIHFIVVLMNEWIAKSKHLTWWFYPVELIVWIVGIITRLNAVANIGLYTLGATISIHLVSSLANRSNKLWLRGLSWILVAGVVISLVTVFYLGFVYLGILPPIPGPFGALIDKIQGLFLKPVGAHHF